MRMQDVFKMNANDWSFVLICLGKFSFTHELTKRFCERSLLY